MDKVLSFEDYINITHCGMILQTVNGYAVVTAIDRSLDKVYLKEFPDRAELIIWLERTKP